MEHLITAIKKAQGYAKAIVATVGSVLVAVSGLSADLGINLVPVAAQEWVTFALVALTAFSTWAVPNFNPDGDSA